MTTLVPALARSGQSRMPLGLPFRTRITVTDVVGAALFGRRFAQSSGISLARAIASMSLDWFMVTTSASRPSITARACLLEPPCDWLMLTSSPADCFHDFWNAGLMSLKNSRETSYETFSSAGAANAGAASSEARAAATAVTKARRSERRELMVGRARQRPRQVREAAIVRSVRQRRNNSF